RIRRGCRCGGWKSRPHGVLPPAPSWRWPPAQFPRECCLGCGWSFQQPQSTEDSHNLVTLHVANGIGAIGNAKFMGLFEPAFLLRPLIVREGVGVHLSLSHDF